MKAAIFFIFVLVLSACEGKFPGERTYSLTDLSGPYKMRKVEIDGVSYLGVLNTDYRGQYGDGSLQFYSLATPAELSLNESLSIRIPSNAADFFYDSENSEIFVLSRNKSQILVFERSGAGFSAKTLNGEALAIDVVSGPQSLAFFEIPDKEKRLLAISSYSNGQLQFFDLDNGRLVSLAEIESLNEAEFDPTVDLDVRIGGTSEAPLALLDARPRKENITSFPIENDLGLRISSRSSGLGELIYLGGEEHTFAVASTLSSSLFNFKFLGFASTSNFFWDLDKFDRGYKQGETSIPGSRDRGFLSIAKDGDGSIFMTSRADNSIYKMDSALINASPETFESPAGSGSFVELNTTVFKEDVQAYRLPIEFDENVNDKVFPRLFHMTVNNQEAGSATRAYVLGLQDPREEESLSRLYLVDLSGNSILATYDFESGDYPQYVYLLEPEGLLYVSVSGADKIRSFDISADTFATTQELGIIHSSKK